MLPTNKFAEKLSFAGSRRTLRIRVPRSRQRHLHFQLTPLMKKPLPKARPVPAFWFLLLLLPYLEGVEKVGAQRFVANRAHRAEQKEFSLVANLF